MDSERLATIEVAATATVIVTIVRVRDIIRIGAMLCGKVPGSS